MRFLAAVLWAGLRVVRGLALVVLVVVALASVALIRTALSSDSQGGGVLEFQAPTTHNYPSPSYWPMSPYPVASAHVAPTPQVTVAPCPSWVPTRVYHSDGDYYECRATIPPDPGTGPMCPSANGGPPYHLPIKGPDGNPIC